MFHYDYGIFQTEFVPLILLLQLLSNTSQHPLYFPGPYSLLSASTSQMRHRPPPFLNASTVRIHTHPHFFTQLKRDAYEKDYVIFVSVNSFYILFYKPIHFPETFNISFFTAENKVLCVYIYTRICPYTCMCVLCMYVNNFQ